ncbi:DNA topoisomerase 2 [Cryptomeria japonica]|uniref:DNA topoisomerase 2 n=1 Tax=Cryptomeria japonica TaxID=3369 RepID=UPI0027DA414B|nr:DNA topoisomerase 2 [Cryptomeria japonica]
MEKEKKAKQRKPLQPCNSNSNNDNISNVNGKSIEETYQKKSQLEHILLRPDTYVGSIERHKQTMWVYENGGMVHKEIEYVPGLYKIFDEILVNAADNKERDPKMNSVKVEISEEDRRISIYNNGDGIPVEIHQQEGVYVPELIFGHLLTSSNYDDNVKKTTGGRNGYGAKLTNIFSTEFIIETADGRRQKKYKQVFSNNMSSKSEPVITKCKEGENWTKVTFKPDLAKFSMTDLEPDVVALMKKRVLDLAGCLGKGVKVELNGKILPIKSFEDYVDLYLSPVKDSDSKRERHFIEVNDRWKVCVTASDGQFQQVSFVNGISTIKGGSHVDYIATQIATYLINIAKKKNKNAAASLKPHAVKSHLWVFVNAKIDNPAFDSQTKDTLTTRQNSFGSTCELTDKYLKSVSNCVLESILAWVDFKQRKELKKTDGTKKKGCHDIPKLEDANKAGGKESEKCTLILTEGDSAKALALAGITVVGRDHYGVFPLRGKLLNVREASHKQIAENQETENIKKILGLQHDKVYENIKSLRYGHLMIMTDQDHDGSHIKGLLINFIHHNWPSLLKIPSFLVEFITPIVRATHKNGKVLSFYTLPEYEAWRESVSGSISGWSIKYYKGLGTSTSKEGKEYFSNLEKHKKDFVWVDEQDGDAIELAFSKKKIEARKNWLRQFEAGTYLDQTEKLISYKDFVNKELILFSRADLQRSIPSMVDGLKPGQRKILFCCFKRNFVKQAKVAQFSGYVSEHSAYHHGEQSLASTIIGMAQDFVGSNNINLLLPVGQFGTRNAGGKDAASPRYVYTCLSPITRFLFPKEDDVLMDYLEEDGQSIEPAWYVPIIPMVLVNGSEGIGTGWSTFVPNYNPRDVVANVRRLLNDEPMQPMDPWYKGFKGKIERTATKENGVTYTISGIIEEIDSTTLRITELPVRKWTDDFKSFLTSMITNKDKDPFIMELDNHSTDTRVRFEVALSEEKMTNALQEGLSKKFKLTTVISTSNMHLFDANGAIQKYETPEQILECFYHIRLEFYVKRKRVLLDNLQIELLKLDNKVRFILGVVNGEIIVSKRKRAELLLELKNKGFTPFPKKSKAIEAAIAGALPDEVPPEDESTETAEGVNGETVEGVRAGDYEYLLSMSIGTLTLEKVQQLCAEKDQLSEDVEELKRKSPKSLWLNDLDNFIRELDALELQEAKDDEHELRNMCGNAAKIFRKVGKNPKKNTKTTSASEKADSHTTNNSEAATVSTTTVTTENAKKSEAAKPKRGGGKKGAAKKQMEVDDEDDDGLDVSLQERLAAYNGGLSAEHSAVEDHGSRQSSPTEDLNPKQRNADRQAKKAPPYVDMSDDDVDTMETIPEASEEEEKEQPKRKTGPNRKKTANVRGRKEIILSDSDSEFAIDEDSESDYEETVPKKGGRKPADNEAMPPKKNAKKPNSTTAPVEKKRGPKNATQGQKKIDEMLKPTADNATGVEASPYKNSPKKKVRKMRPSPFNKKSGSVMPKLNEENETSPQSGDGSAGSSFSPEEVNELPKPVAQRRPQRSVRTTVQYVLSDSDENDEDEVATEDSDFEEDD